MLAWLRRLSKSWIVLAFILFIGIAVVVTGVGTPHGLGSGGGGANGETIVKMKGAEIGAEDVSWRVQLTLAQAKQQDPTLTMASFIAQGGVDDVVRQMATSAAMEAWARAHGLGPGRRQVDGEIASIPGFFGPSGKFDLATFRAVLAQQRFTEAQVRADVASDIIRRQVLSPIGGGTQAPVNFVTPYAEMLIERRDGMIGVVPTSAMPAGPPPGDAAVAAAYKAGIARYSLPERRVIRYAAIGQAQVATAAQPSDAEVAGYYRAHAAEFAASETRSFSRIVFPSEAAARAFVANVRGGTPFAAAAQAAGFAPADTALGVQTQAQLAAAASAPAAAAAFALPEDGTTDPARVPLGFFVAHLDRLTRTPARDLAAARGGIVATLARQKGAAALTKLVNDISDSIEGGATFDEVAKTRGLTPEATQPVAANGAVPTDPAYRLPPAVQPVLKAAFDASPDDRPTVEAAGPDSFVLLKVGTVTPAAPIPLAEVRAIVVRDLAAKAATDRAKAVAAAIAARIRGGMAPAKAFASAGMALPPPQPAGGRQIDLARSSRQVPRELALMFALPPKGTRTLAAAQGRGWYVIHLDTITPGDPKQLPPLIGAARTEFAQTLSEETTALFADAVMKTLDLRTNAAAVARLKAQLAGQAPAAQ